MSQLTLYTRVKISQYKHMGLKPAQIAICVHRHRSTISRELKRNSVYGVYHPFIAHKMAKIRKIEASMKHRLSIYNFHHFLDLQEQLVWLDQRYDRPIHYRRNELPIDRLFYVWRSDFRPFLGSHDTGIKGLVLQIRRPPAFRVITRKPFGHTRYVQLKESLKKHLALLRERLELVNHHFPEANLTPQPSTPSSPTQDQNDLVSASPCLKSA